ncbi:MAG TPA: tetratricopeptide repeat protein [Allosphingosinicella sp.]|jgi:cytochrome c-type biogenesis protein CcmH
MAQAPAPKTKIPPATIALAVAALLALAAIIVAVTRSGDGAGPAASQNAAAPAAAGAGQPGTVEQMIASLRQRLSQDPDNHEAWFLLGLAHRDAGQYREAEQAFRRAMQLQPNNPDYLASTGEALLLTGAENAAREAEPLFRRALEFRRDHAQSRYYMATLKDLTGNHQQAVEELIALLREAPAGAAWASGVRRTVEEIAQRHNIDVAGRLPAAPVGSPATAGIPGPTRQQLEAARAIPPSEQDQMAKGMVDRLAARLQQNPRDENGWVFLMRSRIVQGDQAGAAGALRSALGAFQDDAAAQQRLRAAAAQLGVPQG